MIFHEIETTISFEVAVKTLDEKEMSEGVGILISNGNTYVLLSRAIRLLHPSQKTDIDFYFARNTAHICSVSNRFADGTFTVNLQFFAGEVVHMGDISILVSPDGSKKTGNWEDLAKKSSFTMNAKKYFIIQSSQEEIQNEKDKSERFAFAIMTPDIRIDVEQISTPEDVKKSYFQARRMPKRKNITPQSNYFLVEGTLVFENQRKVISNFTASETQKILKTPGSYLAAWNTYAKEKGEKLLKVARDFGSHAYKQVEVIKNGSGYKLFFETAIEIPQGYKVAVYDSKQEKPLFLTDTTCSFNDYVIKKSELKKEKKDMQQKPIECEVVKCDDNCITVEITKSEEKKVGTTLLESGFITLSTLGEEIQLERQNKASSLITQGKSGIQHLGLLLEDDGQIYQKQHASRGKKLTYHLSKKIFNNEPTEKQREAITIALQTPDIALIQGPPGTGKTTVIRAIIEQLNAMQDKRSSAKGKILATSYQHTAVENMIEKLSVNSLPTYKFGTKKGEENYKEHINEWIKQTVERVNKKNPEISITPQEENLMSLYANYDSFPSAQTERALLEEMKVVLHISAEMRKHIEELLQDIEPEYTSKTKNLLPLIRALRIDKQSYADDGEERTLDLYDALEQKVQTYADDGEERALDLYDALEQKAQILLQQPKNDEFFQNMKKLQKELLEEFSPKPHYIMYRVKSAITHVYEQTLVCINNSKSKTDRKKFIIADWVQQLHCNPLALESAIKDCDFVYAATAQQSDSKELKLVKNNYNDARSFLYDTVIIDEAARASPPDLLIPMCKAAKRIILVGDHRQLPQQVDDDICELLEQEVLDQKTGDDQLIKNPYKYSMFEFLFERLKKLEHEDGIKRTVTLDSQFRSHPVLGEFASEQFYKPHNEGYKSPRKVSDFLHKLPSIENKAAIWLDVPFKKGGEKKTGKSFKRQAEAEAISELLNTFLTTEEGSKLSYGIITFYKAQEDVIKKEVRHYNNVRVGTVDSFQGMEFDVVFLSVVRTNRYNQYGFLKSANRMCVSMTRQKKTLIVVGDSKFCTTELAVNENNIPTLAKFYNVCTTSEYGVVLC